MRTLEKEAVSANLAKKVFDKRNIIAGFFSKDHMRDYKNFLGRGEYPPSISIGERQAVYGKKMALADKKKYDALAHYDKRLKWGEAKKKYGVRSPTVGQKIAHGLSAVKDKIVGARPALGTYQPIPAVAYA